MTDKKDHPPISDDEPTIDQLIDHATDTFAPLDPSDDPAAKLTANGHDPHVPGWVIAGLPNPAGHDDDQSWAPPPVDNPWPEIDAEAFYGLAGEIVDAINPLTEADPVAVLAQLLAAFGCAIGRGSYRYVGDTPHYPALFQIIVGASSKARKGSSLDIVRMLINRAEPTFAQRIKSGLISGEGVIHLVHDGIWVSEKINQGKGNPPTYARVLKEEAVVDKRLLFIEPEFASVLNVTNRAGNILSAVIRNAWDGIKLENSSKHHGETATDAHISIIGHITVDELQVLLNQISISNGFANRFLIVLARRSKELPIPERLDQSVADLLASKLRKPLATLDWRSRIVEFSDETERMWRDAYHDLSAEQPGLFGDLTRRAEAQTLRLAMIYGLLDASCRIQPDHLRAALAFWRYCQASAKYIFGDFLGDPVADDLLRILRQAGPEGRTRNELREMFSHHSARLGQAILLLAGHNKIRRRTRTGTGGRPAEIWIA